MSEKLTDAQVDELHEASSHAHEAWPDWLMEKYGELQLPSLYDYLVEQEKLSSEIRKQNKDIRNCQFVLENVKNDVGQIQGSISNMHDRLDAFVTLHAREEELQKEQVDQDELERIKQEANAFLIAGMDTIFNCLQATCTFAKDLSTIIPKQNKFWCWRRPSWRLNLDNMLMGYSAGVELALQKTIALLANNDVEVIAPKIGDLFDAKLHRAVECVAGHGTAHTIAKIVRYGYKKRGNIVRCADVSVYK